MGLLSETIRLLYAFSIARRPGGVSITPISLLPVRHFSRRKSDDLYAGWEILFPDARVAAGNLKISRG